MLFDSDEDEHLGPATTNNRPAPKKGPPPRPKFQPPEGLEGVSPPAEKPPAPAQQQVVAAQQQPPVQQQQQYQAPVAAPLPTNPVDDDDGPMFANPVQPLPHQVQPKPAQQQQQAAPQQQQQQFVQPQQQFAPQQQQQQPQQQAMFAQQVQPTASMSSMGSNPSLAPTGSPNSQTGYEIPSQQSLPDGQQQQQYATQQQQQYATQQQQQQYVQQQQQFAPQQPQAPVAPLPPPSAADQWPTNLPQLPKAPEQGKVASLAPLPPAPQRVEMDPLKQQFNTATNDNVAWESFLQLRKQLEEAHQRTTDLHSHVSQIQLTHEKEAIQFREAAQAQITRQAKELQQAQEDNVSAVSKIDTISKLISKKAEELMKLEQQVHDLTVHNAAMAQKIAHTEDRARVADGGRQVAEVRQRELELTLEHTAELVVNLRKQMQGSHIEKANALQEQYVVFEQNRSDLIAHYQKREAEMTEQFNVSVRQAMALMDQHVKEREEKVTKHWKDVVVTVEDEYRELKKRNEEQARRHEREVETHKMEITQDKEKWIMHLRKEMELLEQRHKEREDHVLADIGRRERDLSEREQRTRVQRAQDEQDGKINLMTKEAELKAYYEKLSEDMRKGHDVDRERMSQSFRDQIQQLQNMHLNNEKELERMHRDKEREMAQRYRIAGYDVEDTKGDLDRAKASQAAQSSLLSKFDSIETKQRERAEQSRTAFKTTSFSNVATTPGAGK